MHELSVAREIMRIVEAERGRHGFGKVCRIRLRAGAMSGIDRHALEFAFQAIRPGTCAAGARLEMEREPLKMRCLDCGAETDAERGPARCAACRSERLRLEGGSTFEIVSLEVD